MKTFWRKLKNGFLGLVPGYSHLPITAVLVINMLVYYGARLINRGAPHIDLSCAIDTFIPFWPPAVYLYIFWYAATFLGLVLIARDSRSLCFRFAGAELLSKLICFFIFILLPTAMTRSPILGSSLSERLTALIYASDAPNNLFPSIHCLEAYIGARGIAKTKKLPGWFKIGFYLYALLLCASTVLVKQHVFLDIPAAVLVAELGILLEKRIPLAAALEKATDKLSAR